MSTSSIVECEPVVVESVGTEPVAQEAQKAQETRAPAEHLEHQEHLEHPDPRVQSPARIVRSRERIGQWLLSHLERVNKELWLLLSMFVMLGAMNYLIVGHHLILGLYTLPTLFSAYYLGRRHAVLTAMASILIVSAAALHRPALVGFDTANMVRWHDLVGWAGILIVTAYAMGTLHNWHRDRMQELHETYRGLLVVLRQFIRRDDYTENHCYRVSVYAARIGSEMGLPDDQLEDIRSAALLHDIGKLEVSRSLLHKAARLSAEERTVMQSHVRGAAQVLGPVSGPLHRILPIILAHHERTDGDGYQGLAGESIPLGARVIAVADVYDALTSDRPYRKAMAPLAAKESIVGDGGAFDPRVVRAFLRVFSKGGLEIPNILV